MFKGKNNKNEDDIELRAIFKDFSKNKWWFIGTFIIILGLGLFITLQAETEIVNNLQDISFLISALLNLLVAVAGGLMIIFIASYFSPFNKNR